MNQITVRTVNRAANMAGSYGNVRTAPDRVDAENIARVRCELIRQSSELFIKFCYQRDASGHLRNLSGNTSIPTGVWCPWSSAGKPRTAKDNRPQLTKEERMIVRAWLMGLKQARRFPVFLYDGASRRWYVDTMRYESEAQALAWLQSNLLDAKSFVAIKHRLQMQS